MRILALSSGLLSGLAASVVTASCVSEDAASTTSVRFGPDAAATTDAAPVDASGSTTLTAERVGQLVPGMLNSCVITRDDHSLHCVGRTSSAEHAHLPTASDVPCAGSTFGMGRGSASWERIEVGSVDKVAVARQAMCALSAGAIRCWGANDVAQLGHAPGTASDTLCDGIACSPVPEPVRDLPSGLVFTDITAGLRHFCARTDAGAVYCWGQNKYGESSGEVAERVAPRKVTLPGNAVAKFIRSGSTTNCVALEPSGVACWGYSAFWPSDTEAGAVQCAGAPCAPTAVLMGGLETARIQEIGVADRGVCVVSDVGTVLCLGLENLSDGTPLPLHPLPGITGSASALSMGQYNGLAQVGDEVITWGFNGRGALAAGPPVLTDAGEVLLAPAARAGLRGSKLATMSVVANGMALKGDKVLGWGLNGCGQLGHLPGAGDETCVNGEYCQSQPNEIPLPR